MVATKKLLENKLIRVAIFFILISTLFLPSIEIFGINLRPENIISLIALPFLIHGFILRRIKLNFLDLSFVFLAVSFFATIVNSYLINNSPIYWRDFLDLFRVLNYYLIFRFVFMFFDKKNILESFNRVFLLSGAGVMFIAIFQYFDLFYVNKILYLYTSYFHIRGVLISGRPIGTFGHTNEFGLFVAIYIIFIVSLMLLHKFESLKKMIKDLSGKMAFLLIAFIALFMSMSRSALLSLFIGLGSVYFLFIVFHHEKEKIKKILFTLFVVFFVSFSSLFFVKWLSGEFNRANIGDRFEAGFYEFSEDEGLDVLQSKSFSKRLKQWVGAVDVISENPIFGYGPSKATKGDDVRPELVENEYLNITMNYGVVGLMAYIFIYLILARVSLKSIAKGKLGPSLVYSYWAIGILMALFLYNIFLGVYYRTQTFNLLIIIFSVLLIHNKKLLEINTEEDGEN